MPVDNKEPTIYDVAKHSGVSIATVSRVINTQVVSEKTRKAVTDAIDQLGYIPKAEARARALRHNGRIGVITPFFTAPSFIQRLRGVASALSKVNFDLVIYTIDSHNRLQSYLSSLPITGNLDGLIIMSLPVDDGDVNRLLEHRLPTVLIEFPHPDLNCVEIDDVQGGKIAAEYLINKGHRKIAFLGDTDLPEYSIHPVTQRLEGFRQVLEDNGIDLPEEFVRLAPYDQEKARKVAQELFDLPDRPTAIFSATDLQALGVIKAARQLNIKIPDDFAIIGFDDIDMAEYEELTTIRQHLDDSGRFAVEILLAQIKDPSRLVQHSLLPLKLIKRETA